MILKQHNHLPMIIYHTERQQRSKTFHQLSTTIPPRVLTYICMSLFFFRWETNSSHMTWNSSVLSLIWWGQSEIISVTSTHQSFKSGTRVSFEEQFSCTKTTEVHILIDAVNLWTEEGLYRKYNSDLSDNLWCFTISIAYIASGQITII